MVHRPNKDLSKEALGIHREPWRTDELWELRLVDVPILKPQVHGDQILNARQRFLLDTRIQAREYILTLIFKPYSINQDEGGISMLSPELSEETRGLLAEVSHHCAIMRGS